MKGISLVHLFHRIHRARAQYNEAVVAGDLHAVASAYATLTVQQSIASRRFSA